VQHIRPEKRVVLQFERAVGEQSWEQYGRLVSLESRSVVLQVPNDQVSAVVTRALSNLPVKDLTIENPPLEEVMSELFSRSRAAAPEEAA
jgi:ABC-2 type transport system ATP-binding protein